MAADLVRAPELYGRGDKRPIFAENLMQTEVKQDTEVTVWEEEIANDKIAWFGHGSHVKELAESFIYANLVASGNGAGTAGDPIEGELVAAIVDSEQRRVLRDITVDSLGELADAESSDRTDRPRSEALKPYGKPGRYLEFRVVSAAASDGYEIDPSASSARLYYTVA